MMIYIRTHDMIAPQFNPHACHVLVLCIHIYYSMQMSYNHFKIVNKYDILIKEINFLMVRYTIFQNDFL